jgi:alkanesulfonate monooxygenase SsuD/methylene tetrahydromethanopterin reductase-like flavin-dependent oxidoreductase (luciferase family)
MRSPTLDVERPNSRALRSLAQRAEAIGFDSLWCLDHLLPSRFVFDSGTWDPLTTIPFLAGCTERIKLGTSVLVVPLRHRLWLPKQLGTLSALAGERVMLGVGVGYDEREFAAAGADRRTRGRALDDVLEALAVAAARRLADLRRLSGIAAAVLVGRHPGRWRWQPDRRRRCGTRANVRPRPESDRARRRLAGALQFSDRRGRRRPQCDRRPPGPIRAGSVVHPRPGDVSARLDCPSERGCAR